jgi:hypothetical protein
LNLQAVYARHASVDGAAHKAGGHYRAAQVGRAGGVRRKSLGGIGLTGPVMAMTKTTTTMTKTTTTMTMMMPMTHRSHRRCGCRN